MDDKSGAPAAPQQASSNGTSPTAGVPSSWPGGFGLYKYSKVAVKRNLGTIIVLIVLTIIVNIFSNLQNSQENPSGSLLGLSLIATIVGFFVTIASIRAFLSSVRGNTISVGEAFSAAQPMVVLKYFAASLIVGILLIVSFLLFIVPFFFVLPRLILYDYFLVDKNLGPIEAIKASWEATKGHAGKVWSVILATIAMALLMITLIGIPFSIYFLVMYAAALAILYEYINAHLPAPASAALDAAAPVPTIPQGPQTPQA